MKFQRAKIVDCKPKSNYIIWVRFDDGIQGDIDLSHLAGRGVFKKAWQSVLDFNRVKIDPISNTISWGEEVDLDPYVLKESIKSSPLQKSSKLASTNK